jgi:hypothetical protein
MLKSIQSYEEKFNYLITLNMFTNNVPLIVGDTWINIQRKGEFIPNHNHCGIYSFVIWIQIPYNIYDEVPNIDSYQEIPSTSSFEFIYQNILGQTMLQRIMPTKQHEGKMMMFPSKLHHCVYPFFSTNENRISISGNIHFDTSKYHEDECV